MEEIHKTNLELELESALELIGFPLGKRRYLHDLALDNFFQGVEFSSLLNELISLGQEQKKNLETYESAIRNLELLPEEDRKEIENLYGNKISMLYETHRKISDLLAERTKQDLTEKDKEVVRRILKLFTGISIFPDDMPDYDPITIVERRSTQNKNKFFIIYEIAAYDADYEVLRNLKYNEISSKINDMIRENRFSYELISIGQLPRDSLGGIVDLFVHDNNCVEVVDGYPDSLHKKDFEEFDGRPLDIKRTVQKVSNFILRE